MSRFSAHYFAGGNDNEKAEILIKWLGKSSYKISQDIQVQEARKMLDVFITAWKFRDMHKDLRRELAERITELIDNVKKVSSWKKEDITKDNESDKNGILIKAETALRKDTFITKANRIKKKIKDINNYYKKEFLGKGIIIAVASHLGFWLLLMTLYPKSSRIQAIFFWNPLIRKIGGLWYVDILLTNIPFLRTKLFAPFKDSLVEDAAVEGFDERAYFPDSTVEEEALGQTEPLKKAIPEIKNQIVLEGDSGLGKTMFIRHLVKKSKRLVVYLPAAECSMGVEEAVQAKLQGPARDPKFLKSLIFIGAIDICIDGLNEVSPDTRANTTKFIQDYKKANTIVVTQPLGWRPPSRVRHYVLQPLTEEAIKQFLISRQQSFSDDITVSGVDYEQRCEDYLEKVLDKNQPEEVREAAKRVLSNPMDLTLVAQMLAKSEEPDIFHLIEQQYTMVNDDYKSIYHDDFPLISFSETIYKNQLEDKKTLPHEEFPGAIELLEKYKMAFSRQPLLEKDKNIKQWFFRHDKIREFFIVQSFLGIKNDRPGKHLSDPRFRGVYFLLATLMPINEAESLREELINHAVDTKDHEVSDGFIQILRSRKAM